MVLSGSRFCSLWITLLKYSSYGGWWGDLFGRWCQGVFVPGSYAGVDSKEVSPYQFLKAIPN